MILESGNNFDCFDLARTSKSFLTKVYGIKLCIHHEELKKSLVICGIVDDIQSSCIQKPFIFNRIHHLLNDKPSDPDFLDSSYDRFIESLTVKELLIFSSDELFNKFVGYMNKLSVLKQKSISNVVKEFLNDDIYLQRATLIQMLLKYNDIDFHYLSYLLYDLLSNDNNGTVDTYEQTILYDSLPWNIKKYFKEAMKQTIEYTSELSEFDNQKIPFEQQICLMKVSDSIKEKAMAKLKEIKAKSEDSGSKARQYLEGLLKIPFNIYREEPILKVMSSVSSEFKQFLECLTKNESSLTIGESIPQNPNTIEMYSFFNYYKENLPHLNSLGKSLVNTLITLNKKDLTREIQQINKLSTEFSFSKLNTSGSKAKLGQNVIELINTQNSPGLNIKILDNLNVSLPLTNSFLKINQLYNSIDVKLTSILSYMNSVNTTLDDAIYGHDKAKRQVERIIGQWINGTSSGHCFGFEGPPGVGKTSLAKKGIANCLKDNDGVSRPFSFIAVGGSTNGSTIDGHNYTYVGSTWGRIVEILIETKCMNPIIFIDELDKISKTEHGKEIIGIFTHLTDATQNDSFQDKYFSGIDIDLSKALFIFSYNDPHSIDRILLDRIHRVKFSHLTVKDKLVVTKKHILPEIFEKVGLSKCFDFNDSVIEFIINSYTMEPGVRKLKEILFEIISEINLELLKGEKNFPSPILVTEDMVKELLKERDIVKVVNVHKENSAGLINGLWANAMGRGGIIQIEVNLFVTSTLLDLKLTGQQGDVMKESMTVAKTLAWNLLSDDEKKLLIANFEQNKTQGIHIHCPEGATPKDGPSAGTAITTAIYSKLTDKKIKNTIAITGEINLQGNVTEIGGLDLKILGGIAAGVKEFIFPKENEKDFKKLKEKYGDSTLLDNIKFHSVTHISQVLELVFE
jgi:ATP-dependent Lon protease